MLVDGFFFDDCCKRKYVQREGAILVRCAGVKCEKRYENDGNMLLSLNGLLLRALASVVPVLSRGVTGSATLTLFSSHPREKWLVYIIEKTSERTDKNCCGEAIEFLAGSVLSGWKSFLRELMDECLDGEAFRSETFILSAPMLQNVALRATVSSSRAFRELLRASSCLFRISVRTAFPFSATY